jgi:CheY-like chemotaxis protein
MIADDKKTLAALRVLIVEDAPLVAKLIRMVLGGLGVTHVTLAADGAEALAKIDQAGDASPFGLVICDWMMPGMDGITFLGKFRALDKTTPFVMLTAKTDATEFHEAKRAGASYFLMKPLEPDELELRLLAVIEATVLSG